MKKESFILFVLPFVVLAFGLFAGFYFGVYRTSIAVTACELEKSLIPPSPVITHSKYDPKTDELVLRVKNPGGMPILLVNKSLVLQPAGGQPVALMVQIPLGIEIPPYGDVTLKLALGPQGSGFKMGDVLVTTLTYQLPVSNDVYSVMHLFQHSGKTEGGYITNKLEENYEVQRRYEEKVRGANQSTKNQNNQTETNKKTTENK
jgi:hypothetical protein